MRLVLLSDTHTMHDKVSVPDGDVLCHAGDLALDGSAREVQQSLDWLNLQPHSTVIAIAGNHDWAFQCNADALELGRVLYLENSSCHIDGVDFYGSPVTPEFCDWAFNVPRGNAIKRYWDAIPEHVDVLLTHGPPRGILDQSRPGKSHPLGCEELLPRIEVLKPKVHAFGHIHGAYGQRESNGTKFFNCSVVNEVYRVVNQPHVVDI